jgi:hypothetical protein
MENENMEQVIAKKSLTLGVGAELSPEKVAADICPDCSSSSSYCQFRLKIWLSNPELAFVCPGMRTWVTKSN